MKTYVVFCHVCKQLKEYQADFLSVRDYQDVGGKSYPVMTCGVPIHSAEEIRASYKNRMALRQVA